MRLRERAHRLALAAYPRRFREQHAAELLETLEDGAAQRGALGEAREVAGLLAGAVRARGEDARRADRDAWRHGAALLLAPLSAVNLAVILTASWAVHHPAGGGVARGLSAWWLVTTLAAVGLVVAVATARRGPAIAAAALGLAPLAWDQWLQASARGDGDHFARAAHAGFGGPSMSPFWLYLAVVVLIAAVAARPAAAARRGRASRRGAALVAGAVAVAATIPLGLHALLGAALLGVAVCVPLGAWDRRLHGTALALWTIALPYVAWWAASRPEHPNALLAYLAVLPLTATVAWRVRRRRRLAV